MPMMTTTIRSSISVKPFLLRTIVSPLERKKNRLHAAMLALSGHVIGTDRSALGEFPSCLLCMELRSASRSENRFEVPQNAEYLADRMSGDEKKTGGPGGSPPVCSRVRDCPPKNYIRCS